MLRNDINNSESDSERLFFKVKMCLCSKHYKHKNEACSVFFFPWFYNKAKCPLSSLLIQVSTSLYRVSGQQTCPLYIIISDFVVWGWTSACKGAPGSRYHSIFDLTHPTHTLAKGSHNTGNFMPYSFRIVCGFFNVPHWTNKHGRYLRDGTYGL